MSSKSLKAMKRALPLIVLALGLVAPCHVAAQQAPLPDLSISIGGSELAGGGSVASSLKIVVLYDLLYPYRGRSRNDSNGPRYGRLATKYRNHRLSDIPYVLDYGTGFSEKL